MTNKVLTKKKIDIQEGSFDGEANGTAKRTLNPKIRYQVTLVKMSDLTLIKTESNPSEVKIAHPPRYDAQRDEPAFQKAWQKVAEAKARGEVTAPKLPPNGIRLRGSRANSK